MGKVLTELLTLRRAALQIRIRLTAMWRLVAGAVRIIVEEGRAHLRLDLPLIIMLLGYLIAFAPVVSRVTENPRILDGLWRDDNRLHGTRYNDIRSYLRSGRLAKFRHQQREYLSFLGALIMLKRIPRVPDPTNWLTHLAFAAGASRARN